jgi:hypothetical protein
MSVQTFLRALMVMVMVMAMAMAMVMVIVMGNNGPCPDFQSRANTK